MLSIQARVQVASILGFDLRAASVWADCVKGVNRTREGGFLYQPNPRFRASCARFETEAGIAEMVRYAGMNWDQCGGPNAATACHRSYHYANVAIQRDRYDPGFTGASGHDIVSATQAAIAVLTGGPIRVGTGVTIDDRKIALMLLAHLVGDLHQPLHVGAAYLDSQGRLADPDRAGASAGAAWGTRGGNWIEIAGGSLHSEWDATPRSARPDQVDLELLPVAVAAGVEIRSETIPLWPVAWATDTLRVTPKAFERISYSQVGREAGHWTARFHDRREYMAQKAAIQSAQLEKAGGRLAKLLNAIWP